MTAAAFKLVYHVPRSQVWEGSRGGQSGAAHLHAADDVTLSAKLGRCGTLHRVARQSLCSKRGWYERSVESERDLRIRCAECVKRAERYGVEWPAWPTPDKESPDGT